MAYSVDAWFHSYAAFSPEVSNGDYCQDSGQHGGETDQGKDIELQENLWKLSTELAEKYLGEDGLKSWE